MLNWLFYLLWQLLEVEVLFLQNRSTMSRRN
jgi:hypothetical protein